MQALEAESDTEKRKMLSREIRSEIVEGSGLSDVCLYGIAN